MHGGAVEHPGLVRPGQEDVTATLDVLQHATVSAAADALGSKQSHAPGTTLFEHRACLLMPVADKVGLTRDATVVDLKQ